MDKKIEYVAAALWRTGSPGGASGPIASQSAEAFAKEGMWTRSHWQGVARTAIDAAAEYDRDQVFAQADKRERIE